MSAESAIIKIMVDMECAKTMMELVFTYNKIRCTKIPAILKMQFMAMEIGPAARRIAAARKYQINYIITRLIPSM